MFNGYGYLVFAIFMTAMAQLLYKQYFLSKHLIYILLSILCFISIPIATTMALKYLSLDIVYMASSLIIILILLFSNILFNEKISQHQILSITLIILGIVAYNL